MYKSPSSVYAGLAQHRDRTKQKTLGRNTRAKALPRRKPRRTRRTGRQLNFKGLTFIVWNEDINILGQLDPRLAFKIDTYAWAKSDDQRKDCKEVFWNNQKGMMKSDFERAANLLMDFYGSNTSPQGRVILSRN